MAFKRMKFEVNGAAHSALIQAQLFNLGYYWEMGWVAEKTAQYQNAQYLYADIDGVIKYGTEKEYFEEANQFKTCHLVDGIIVPVEVLKELTEPAPKEVEQPIGLRPIHAVAQDRLKEILEAMLRYAAAGKSIPDEWDNEYDELREWLNEHYSQQ